MKPWFRHYVGMTRDDKLAGVAGRTRQPLDRVLFVWISILESASELESGGAFTVDAESIAYNIRCEPADVVAILAALEVAERTCDGVVTRWKDRQFESDTSRDRMRRHRNRDNGDGNGGKPHRDGTKNGSDGDVTSQNSTVTRPELRTSEHTSSLRSDGGDAAETEPEDDAPHRNVTAIEDAELYRRGAAVLRGNRALVTKLKAHRGGSVALARADIERASIADDPVGYVGGILSGKFVRAGPGREPPRNPRLAAADDLLAKLHERAHQNGPIAASGSCVYETGA